MYGWIAIVVAAGVHATTLSAMPARALEALTVRADISDIDLTAAVEWHRTSSDRILVSNARGFDGIVRRMDIRAREDGGNKNWAVFALANPGNRQIERLIVVPHNGAAASGPTSPDLGRSHVIALTSSSERPERVESATADVFHITLDPGVVLTYVAELRTNEMVRFYLWDPDAYRAKGSLR
jgi:hypothetical protein